MLNVNFLFFNFFRAYTQSAVFLNIINSGRKSTNPQNWNFLLTQEKLNSSIYFSPQTNSMYSKLTEKHVLFIKNKTYFFRFSFDGYSNTRANKYGFNCIFFSLLNNFLSVGSMSPDSLIGGLRKFNYCFNTRVRKNWIISIRKELFVVTKYLYFIRNPRKVADFVERNKNLGMLRVKNYQDYSLMSFSSTVIGLSDFVMLKKMVRNGLFNKNGKQCLSVYSFLNPGDFFSVTCGQSIIYNIKRSKIYNLTLMVAKYGIKKKSKTSFYFNEHLSTSMIRSCEVSPITLTAHNLNLLPGINKEYNTSFNWPSFRLYNWLVTV